MVTVNRACTGKRPHPSRALAEKHRWRLVRRGASPTALQTYPCKHCSTQTAQVWHVGHTQRRMKWRKTR